MQNIYNIDIKSEIDKIVNFRPMSITHYYNSEGYTFYFAVILKDGIIDTKSYPTGRIITDKLNKNDIVLCFKKTVKKNGNIELQLREEVTQTLNSKNTITYNYIKDKFYTNEEPYKNKISNNL